MAVQPYLRTLNFPELMDCTEFNILPSKIALRWEYAWPLSVIELNATTRSYHSHTLSIKLYLTYVMTSMKRKYFRISHDASPIRMGFVACRTMCLVCVRYGVLKNSPRYVQWNPSVAPNTSWVCYSETFYLYL